MNDIRLKRQLRAQAATRQEANDLAVLANELHRTSLPHLSRDAKRDIAEQLDIHPRRYRIERRLSLATSFAVVAFLAVSIQTATPQSHMYSIKSAVDKLIPWSHQSSAPRQPLIPSVGQPVQSLPTPTTHNDGKTAAPPTHATPMTSEQEQSKTTAKPSELLPRQTDASNKSSTEKLPGGLHDILSHPLSTQSIDREKL